MVTTNQKPLIGAHTHTHTQERNSSIILTIVIKSQGKGSKEERNIKNNKNNPRATKC